MSVGYYIIVFITIILVLILRILIRKSKNKKCGSICLFPDQKTPPLKKSKTYREQMEEIRKKLESIKHDKKEKK